MTPIPNEDGSTNRISERR